MFHHHLSAFGAASPAAGRIGLQFLVSRGMDVLGVYLRPLIRQEGADRGGNRCSTVA